MKPYIIPNDDRDYTDTIKFQKKKQKWKESGMSEKDIEKLTNLYHNFDVWGNDKGCNYSNTVIAFFICFLRNYDSNITVLFLHSILLHYYVLMLE